MVAESEAQGEALNSNSSTQSANCLSTNDNTKESIATAQAADRSALKSMGTRTDLSDLPASRENPISH